nr:MAG TPA: hypothetical protein [Caudoviricetes sp.]
MASTSEECRLIPPCMNGRAVCPNSGLLAAARTDSQKRVGPKNPTLFFYVKLRCCEQI